MAIPLSTQAPPIREADGDQRVGRTGATLETVLWVFQQGATPDYRVARLAATLAQL